MLNILTSLLDPYSRKARLQPALLSLLPAFFGPLLLVPEFQTIWAAVGGLVVFSGGATLLTHLGRGRGKALESKLFQAWGGKPSVSMLRHRDTTLPSLTKERYRSFVAAHVPGLVLAAPEAEQTCPIEADDAYESATSWLLARTRDRGKFGLLFQENINYGFRRNIWALKPWALAIDSIFIVIITILEADSWTGNIPNTLATVTVPVWACLILTVFHMLIFAFIIQPDWVRVQAEAYARQLLAACDTLANSRQINTV